MTNTVEVEGGWRTQTSAETRPWAFDLTKELDAGDVVAAATSKLTDLLTGASYPTGLPTPPVASATVPHVTQTVAGLLAGHNYRLEVTADVGGTKRTSSVLKITVPH